MTSQDEKRYSFSKLIDEDKILRIQEIEARLEEIEKTLDSIRTGLERGTAHGMARYITTLHGESRYLDELLSTLKGQCGKKKR